MATGKVKWFNNAKGYGFILPQDGGEDLFAHYSSIEMEGYKTLKAGQDVELNIIEGPKGQHAVDIRSGSETEAETETESKHPAEVDGVRAEAMPRSESRGEAHEETEPGLVDHEIAEPASET